MLKNESLKDFTKALSSKSPVPGGGGACALAAVLASALGIMVGNLTLGKTKYAQNEPEMIRLIDRAQRLRGRLLELIDADAGAFAPLAKAYSMPKESPEREKTMESCLKAAAEVPMKILELSCEIIELQEKFAGLGSRLAVSDAGTGAALAKGAMLGAALNVFVNTKSMKDRELAHSLNEKASALSEKYSKRSDEIYDKVRNYLLD